MPTPEQSARALELANRIRFARAGWKRDLRGLSEAEALRAFARLVEDVPGWALTWRMADVLRALPVLGAVKARRLMSGWMMREQIRLGSLTERQRGLVVAWALERAERRRAA
jgi:hypothetical protein